MKKKCKCGCGRSFVPTYGRKYASPECSRQFRLIERACRYCGGPVTGRQREICALPECQEQKHKDALARNRATEKLRSDKAKLARLKKNPIYCANCGEPFGVKDNIQVPACHRCAEWWETEREVRRSKRNDALSARRSATRKKKKPVEVVATKIVKPTFLIRPDDFTHEKYVDGKKEAKQPNGYKCTWDGCGKALKGPNRFFCEYHRGQINYTGGANAFLGEGGEKGGRSSAMARLS